MKVDIQLKLTEFKTFTARHPEFDNALALLQESIDLTLERGEQSGVVLTGVSGTGKTTVCNTLISMYPAPQLRESANGVNSIIPTLYCRVPADTTLKHLVSEMLGKLGSTKNAEHRPILEHRLLARLRECQTELVFFDELQNLLEKGQEATRGKVCDWINWFCNEFDKPVVLVGLPTCASIVENNEQLSLRYPFRAELHPLPCSINSSRSVLRTTLSTLISEIVSWNYFDSVPCLTDKKLEMAFFVATGGNMRAMRFLLQRALKISVKRPDRTLLVSDFSIALSRTLLPTRLASVDPFTMDMHELHNIIKGQKKCRK
jgi:hypothetical protein